MDELKTLIQQFMPFAKKQMGFSRPPRLFLRQDDQNASNPLGKTGFYDPQGESITIYVTNRHPKDILRSLAHELMHHTQKCNGDFENTEGMGEQGYAQNSPHMRNMEIQAYQASIVFRDWEDSLKETIYYEHLQKGANKAMSTKEWKNGELTTLLSEAWGFNFDLQSLNETGAKDTGASEGDESKTDPGEKDYTTKKGEKKKTASPGRGEKKGDEAYVNETQHLDEMTGLEPVAAGLIAAGLDTPLAAAIGQLAVGSGFSAAILGLLSRHDPGLSPEAQAVATGEDDEELEEGGAALRQGNEDRLQQRHAHADRIHEDEELEENWRDRMADKRRRSSAPTGRPGGAGIERGSAGPGGSQTRDVCYDAQGNRIDCVEASAIEAPEPGHPARAVAEEGFMGFGKKDAGGEDADGDGCVDAAAGPCKRCKNKGGKWIAGQGGAGKCVYGDITEAQIREIAKRVIERLKKTTK